MEANFVFYHSFYCMGCLFLSFLPFYIFNLFILRQESHHVTLIIFQLTQYLDLAGLKLIEFCLPQLLSSGLGEKDHAGPCKPCLKVSVFISRTELLVGVNPGVQHEHRAKDNLDCTLHREPWINSLVC